MLSGPDGLRSVVVAVKLVDKAVRALAFRWVKGKVDGARKGGSDVLKALDGQKRLIVVLGFIASGLVALLTGQDVSQWLDFGLRATGYTDAEMIAGAKDLATQIVPLVFAIWAAGHGLWKLYKERKAGATVAEMGSTAGAVKAAVADGSLVVANNSLEDPAVLELAGTPVVGRVHGETVTP